MEFKHYVEGKDRQQEEELERLRFLIAEIRNTGGRYKKAFKPTDIFRLQSDKEAKTQYTRPTKDQLKGWAQRKTPRG